MELTLICSSSRYFRQNLPSIDFYSRHPCQRSSIQSTFPFYRFCSISPTRFSHPRRPGCRLFLTFLFFSFSWLICYSASLCCSRAFSRFLSSTLFFSAQATFTAFYSFLEPFTPFTPFHGALFFFLVGRLIRRQLLRGGDRYCERNRSRRACESCVSTRLRNASFFSPPPRSTTSGVSTRFALRRLCRESERFLAYAKSIARTDDVA